MFDAFLLTWKYHKQLFSSKHEKLSGELGIIYQEKFVPRQIVQIFLK